MGQYSPSQAERGTPRMLSAWLPLTRKLPAITTSTPFLLKSLPAGTPSSPRPAGPLQSTSCSQRAPGAPSLAGRLSTSCLYQPLLYPPTRGIMPAHEVCSLRFTGVQFFPCTTSTCWVAAAHHQGTHKTLSSVPMWTRPLPLQLLWAYLNPLNSGNLHSSSSFSRTPGTVFCVNDLCP